MNEIVLRFTHDEVVDGVRERRFEVVPDGQVVPGVLWTPPDGAGARPKVLLGHGGTQHKKAANIVALATGLVRRHGYAALCIDGVGHGERVSPEAAEAFRRRAASIDPSTPRYRGDSSGGYAKAFLRGVREWIGVLDAVEAEPDVGSGPTGWWGVSMGTSVGLPLVATEPRFRCAVLGLASTVERPGHDDYLRWAKGLELPLLFLSQRDDGGHPIEHALALFDLFGSADKTMHLNPGPHVGIPPFEQAEAERFFVRHLGTAQGSG